MLVKVTDAARRVNKSDNTIRRYVREKRLRGTTRGSTLYVDMDEVLGLFPDHTRSEPSAETRVIALCNQKGGVGKTTVAINLSVGLALAGNRVLLIDSDPQGNCTTGLAVRVLPDGTDAPDDPEARKTTRGRERTYTRRQLYDTIVDEEPLSMSIITPLPREAPTLHLVPSAIKLANTDAHLFSDIFGGLRLQSALKSLLSAYDYVVIDCPPSLSQLTMNALIAATDVIVPQDMGTDSLDGLKDLQLTMSKIENNVGTVIRRWALVNKFTNTNLAKGAVTALTAAFAERLFTTKIPNTVNAGESKAMEEPVVFTHPNTAIAEAYRSLTQEVIGWVATSSDR